MLIKKQERERAVHLRKQGFSYAQILKKIPVAKSTLSLWLREVGLSKPQKQRLTQRRLEAARRGAQKKQQLRIERSTMIIERARREVPKLIKNPFWLTGVLLYWAEGAKQKEWNVSQRIAFSNMDKDVIQIFQKWAQAFLENSILYYELFIHEEADVTRSRIYWAGVLHVSPKTIRVYYKTHKLKINRKNINKNYHGTIRICMFKSVDANRRIAGWVGGVVDYLNRGFTRV